MIHKRLILARHGQTEWNNSFRYQGRTDVNLDLMGMGQARRLALRMKANPPQAIYASPLQRALRTAGSVARVMDPPMEPRILDGLVEIDFGAWEGLAVKEVDERYGEDYLRWKADPYTYTPPGGESFDEVVQRVGGAMQTVLAAPEETALVVSHGGTIRAALVGLLNLPFSLAWRMRQDNCAITVLDFWDGIPMLAFCNDKMHLLVSEERAGELPVPE
jgi:alpha-ribazole phosphatase/probable phosphoglycerate mutase